MKIKEKYNNFFENNSNSQEIKKQLIEKMEDIDKKAFIEKECNSIRIINRIEIPSKKIQNDDNCIILLELDVKNNKSINKLVTLIGEKILYPLMFYIKYKDNYELAIIESRENKLKNYQNTVDRIVESMWNDRLLVSKILEMEIKTDIFDEMCKTIGKHKIFRSGLREAVIVLAKMLKIKNDLDIIAERITHNCQIYWKTNFYRNKKPMVRIDEIWIFVIQKWYKEAMKKLEIENVDSFKYEFNYIMKQEVYPLFGYDMDIYKNC